MAPSPSGYLHVGSARTAIFNWLYARQNNGKFVVRIEDTDTSRSDADLVGPILDAMKWLGLDWDEEPIFQSQRLDRYTPFVEKLLETGFAYRCFKTPEEMEQKRKELQQQKKQPKLDRNWLESSSNEEKSFLEKKTPFAVRIRIPDGKTEYEDVILGKIIRQNNEIEDFVICRSDGRAVYNMAVVVDDHEMGITHVIRGNDHITNTFKQVLVYKALNLELPKFAHIPLILRPDKKKVSKRLGDRDVAEYGKEGILPEALFNFLCLLGWSPKDDREYLSLDELIEAFKLENVNASNPIFDEDKLLALNAEYIRKTEDYKLAELTAPLFISSGLVTKYWLETRWDYLLKVIAMLKERCRRLTDFVSQGAYFFTDEFTYDEKASKKQFTPEGKDKLGLMLEGFEKADPFNKESLESVLNEISEKHEIKRAALIHPTRLAVSGVPGGPGLFDMLEALGKDQVIKRIEKAIAYIDKIGGEG